jgi:predicted DNA-binding protein (MmcQ/YjbR family)
MVRVKDESGTAADELRAFGLRYPGAHTKSPWPGHLDLAVKDKTFAYLSVEGEPLKISCKLPQSAEVALSLPFTEPTPYGLGKSGWVTARFPDDMPVPVELLREWIDESYRAQAPKRLSAGLAPLGGAAESVEARSLARKPRAAAKRAAPEPAAVKRTKKKRAAAKRVAVVAKASKAATAAKAPRAAKARAPAVARAPRAPGTSPAAKRSSTGAKKRGSGRKRAAS